MKGANGVPVLINQFGSERRMQMALGVDRLDEIAERIRQLLNMKSPEGFLEKLKMLPMLADMGKFFPKTVATGPCKEVIKKKDFSLLDFPVLQCWPQDGGRFITLPCVITRDPKTGKRNVGMYRIQVYDATSAGMHWQRQKVAAEHYRDMLRALRQQPERARREPVKRSVGWRRPRLMQKMKSLRNVAPGWTSWPAPVAAPCSPRVIAPAGPWKWR